MTIDKASLLRRIDGFPQSESTDIARKVLSSTDVEPLSGNPGRVTVSNAISLWGLRLRNVEFTKRPIQGVEWLLRRLETLGSEDELEQFNFWGPELVGHLFFANSGQEFVGALMVEGARPGALDPSGARDL